MNQEIVSQILFWTVAILAALIAYEFYKSHDGLLRILIINLFIAKVWVYGGAAIFYLLVTFGYLKGVPIVMLRIVLTLPMFIIMIQLYRFIKWGK